jgi:MFS family permease
VYPLLFAASGLSIGQISTLYLIWSLAAFTLEVPCGALADRVSRRRLLAVASLIRAVGFALWIVAPSYPAFAAGFLLWGVASALSSGTWEALLYDELAAAGAAERYAQVNGRSEVASTLGVVAGTALAAPLVAIGGYPAAGWASVATCVAAAAAALALPERPRAQAADEAGGASGYLRTLRAGLAEARSDRRVRRLVLAGALLLGLTALDEYLALLAQATGVAPALVPVLLLAPYLGLAVGAELAGRRTGIRPGRLALVTAAGAVLLAGGALVGHPLGFLGIGACYAALWYGSLVCGARLQETMTGSARATVTSVAGLGEEIVALAVFAGFGLASTSAGIPVLIAANAVPMLLIAAAMPRWLPAARPSPPPDPPAAPPEPPALPPELPAGLPEVPAGLPKPPAGLPEPPGGQPAPLAGQPAAAPPAPAP